MRLSMSYLSQHCVHLVIYTRGQVGHIFRKFGVKNCVAKQGWTPASYPRAICYAILVSTWRPELCRTNIIIKVGPPEIIIRLNEMSFPRENWIYVWCHLVTINKDVKFVSLSGSTSWMETLMFYSQCYHSLKIFK